ncbi:PD-(D/E)XK motif protein [Micromonospora chersina]|uniref:PD-(D/E)XK motif protein n=1 Tax=Micromonospora chersina TaxID=47854 RepID=UPI0034089FA8
MTLKRRRHLSVSGFRQYLATGVAMEHPVDGEPTLTLAIDPNHPSISLRGPLLADEASPHVRLEHIDVRPWPRDRTQLQVRITEPSLFVDAYPILCSIADRTQLGGQGFATAVTDTVRLLSRLLERSRSLAQERELGLCGELLVLLGACRRFGPERAVAGWRGPHREEHDFAIGHFDVEVKTTSSERRAHWIDSLTQLQPTTPTPLWLVSHQLTEAGPGQGWRLGDLVGAVREAVIGSTVRDDLDRRLAAAGWADTFGELCVTRWRRRVASSAYIVAGDFPRLTANQLTSAALDHSSLTDVRYRIDLTHQATGAPVPEALADIIATEGTT